MRTPRHPLWPVLGQLWLSLRLWPESTVTEASVRATLDLEAQRERLSDGESLFRSRTLETLSRRVVCRRERAHCSIQSPLSGATPDSALALRTATC